LKKCKLIFKELRDSLSTIKNGKGKLLESGKLARFRILCKQTHNDCLRSKADIETSSNSPAIIRRRKSMKKLGDAKPVFWNKIF